MKVPAILFLVFAGIYFVKCEHLIMGDASNKHLVYHRIAQFHHIPLKKRVKDVFFSSPDLRPINAIMAYDNLHSKASATITAGGLGSTYVNIRLKSERGMGLEYDVGIYSNERQIVSGARHNTECGVTSEANWRRQHAFSVDSAPADSGGIGSTFVGVEAKRGVEIRHSTYNDSRIRKVRSVLALGSCKMRVTMRS